MGDTTPAINTNTGEGDNANPIPVQEAPAAAPTMAQLLATIEQLQKDNETLLANQASKRKGEQTISYKVSAKGGVSVYGLQRMPVTLYASQWDVLLNHANGIRSFIEANKAKLSIKKEE